MLCDGSLNNAGVFSIQLLAALYSFLRLQLPRIISSFTWFVGWLKSANTSVFKGFLTWVYYSESVNSPDNTSCSHVSSLLMCSSRLRHGLHHPYYGILRCDYARERIGCVLGEPERSGLYFRVP